MALSYLSNNIIEGLVSDIKPTSNIPINTIFIETNYIHRRAFRWNGASWNPLVENGYDALRNRTVISEFYIRNGSYGSNLFEGLANLFGAGSTGFPTSDTTDGHYRYYGTGSSGAGAKQGRATNMAVHRKWKPRLYFINKIFSSTTNISTFIGFASVNDGTNLHATAPLPSQHGIGIGALTNQTNLQIIHNAGSASPTLIDTGVAKNTTIKSCEIWSDDTNWYIALEGDSAIVRTISSAIPSQTQQIYPTWGVLTNDTTDRYMYLYRLVLQTNTPD